MDKDKRYCRDCGEPAIITFAMKGDDNKQMHFCHRHAVERIENSALSDDIKNTLHNNITNALLKYVGRADMRIVGGRS